MSGAGAAVSPGGPGSEAECRAPGGRPRGPGALPWALRLSPARVSPSRPRTPQAPAGTLGAPELSILQSLSMAPPLFSQDGCVCFVSSRAVFPLTSLVRIHHRAPSGSFLGDGVAGRRIVRGPTHPVLPAPDPPRPRVAPHIHPGSTSPGGVEQP